MPIIVKKVFLDWIISTLVIFVSVVQSAYCESARKIAESTFPSVVLLIMEDANRQPVSLGSGFFVSNNVVATAFHLIENTAGGYAKIVGQNIKYEIAGIVGIDQKRDLALLSLKNANQPFLSLGNSRQVAVGDEVFAVGNPQGLEGTFSQGIVSGIRSVDSDTLIQITASLSPGSSGGAVLNAEGKVIGIAVATFQGGQNLNFAIPVQYLASLLLNQQPISPLSELMISNQGAKSILDNIGESSSGLVVGEWFLWDSDPYAHYKNYAGFTFSIHNKLR